MSLDIGTAFREGVTRTFSRNGLVLVVVFVAISLVSTVLFQTFLFESVEWLLEFHETSTPSEMGFENESQYEQSLNDTRTLHDEVQAEQSLAVGLPLGVAAGGLLALALLSETASIVAVRVFATAETDDVPRELVTENLLLATVNGFVGGLITWALILVPLGVSLMVASALWPAGVLAVVVIAPIWIFLAVVLFFLRQEIALNDKNFVQAMADSWRLTDGHRVNVFALGLVLIVVIWSIVLATDLTVRLVSILASDVLTAILGGVTVGGGLLGVFGAAVATRAYVQLDGTGGERDVDADDEADPYAAALGPDDIPE